MDLLLSAQLVGKAAAGTLDTLIAPKSPLFDDSDFKLKISR
jgi:hypothetical protein